MVYGLGFRVGLGSNLQAQTPTLNRTPKYCFGNPPKIRERLEQLVMAVNDLMESRIDANLKIAPWQREGGSREGGREKERGIQRERERENERARERESETERTRERERERERAPAEVDYANPPC